MSNATAWLIYGIKISETDSDLVDDVLRETNHPDYKISYVQAGAFDNQDIYLVAFSNNHRADAPAKPLGMDTLWVGGGWDLALINAATAIGELEVPEPAWMLVADLDY